MYVQTCIPLWIELFCPDFWRDTIEDYKTGLIQGCVMRFGELIVSIQWSKQHYCDHYVGKSYFTYNPSPIYKGQYQKVSEAEVAIICTGRYDFRDYGVFRHYISYDGYDEVRAYATISEIEEIISVCAAYARAQ